MNNLFYHPSHSAKKNTFYILIFFLVIFFSFMFSDAAFSQQKEMHFEYVGIAVQKEGMHVWCTSPIEGPDGKFHFYVSQWSMSKQSNFSGWYKDCEIAHYISNSPTGPFEFVRVAIPDLDGEFNSPHNPTIQFIDGKYALNFIVNENNDLSKQRIIMYISDDLNDNWRPAGGAESDGTILRASSDSTVWNFNPWLGVTNPSLIKYKGKYMLYDKSVLRTGPDGKGKSWVYGVAIADKLEGPYTHHPKNVTPLNIQLEDACAFVYNDSVCLISRDFRGMKGSRSGGLLWKSSDGLFFDAKYTGRSYESLVHYIGEESLKNASVYRGSKEGDLERPQLLFHNGLPAFLYVASGVSTKPGYGSCSHVFKITYQ